MNNKEYHVGKATITYIVNGEEIEERQETGQLLIPSLMFLADFFILAKGKKQIAIPIKSVINMELDINDETYWVKESMMNKDIKLRGKQKMIEQKQMEESLNRNQESTNVMY